MLYVCLVCYMLERNDKDCVLFHYSSFDWDDLDSYSRGE